MRIIEFIVLCNDGEVSRVARMERGLGRAAGIPFKCLCLSIIVIR